MLLLPLLLTLLTKVSFIVMTDDTDESNAQIKGLSWINGFAKNYLRFGPLEKRGLYA